MVESPISLTNPILIRGNNELILLVEDDIQVLRLAKLILEEYGYQVLSAANSIEALRVWETNMAKINLLFSDVVMPGKISGIELANLLTKEKPELKVVITSGYNMEMIDKGYQAKNFEFLPKPYTPMDLLKIIHLALSSSHKQL